ncbi:p23 chaperone protein wos2 [Tilletia horrida]|uniref:P23 chaperone protein wos2 n=1 Tax=Tilletia horrida TaxID=155126 RepID=A0AAN6GCJ0_9BASI|nr:p23 chaperone protein wos2 [Tilletia horrida]KAK0532480.1 p23 chaperone protein wos2 [Tilletia horrida]KAK0534015.1 p23 chaperone protein wos2 [Tilletia horrida]
MPAATTIAPEVLWAQRSHPADAERNVVMLTINAPNLPPSPATKLDLSATGLKFEAEVPEDKAKGIEGKHYAFQLDFYEEIDVENSKQHQNAKQVYLVLRKAKAQEEFWPRLTKEKVKLHFVKTDFDKWVDEDEQDGEAAALDDPMGMGGFGGGAGGLGGMDPAAMGLGGLGGLGGGLGGGEMDLQKMLANMGGAGGPGGFNFDDDDEEDGEGEGEEGEGADASAGGAGAEAESAEAAAPAVESKLKDVESVD